MKKRIVMIFAAAMAAIGAQADTWTDPDTGYTWTYQINGDTAEIYYNYYSAAISPSPTGAVTIPSTLGGKSVTSIGSSAFSGCSGLTSVTIPDSVTSIGSSAFSGCSGLTSVTIPDSVTSIGSSVFSGCSGIRDVTISQCVLDRQISNVFSSSYSTITNVSYSSIITNIGYRAFSYCSGLTSVTIPDNVTSIGANAFDNCSGLTGVTIPDSVTSIGYQAFSYCSGLTSVTIPDSVTSIGPESFYNCSGLEEITLPFVGARRGSAGSSDSVFGYIFGAWSYSGGRATRQYYSSGACSDYYIPSRLKKVVVTDVIGPYAFNNCNGLTNVTIAAGVTSVGSHAFENCNGFYEVTIPSSVTNIGEYAFEGCDGLTIRKPSEGMADGLWIEGDWLLGYVGDAPAEVTVPEGVKHIAPFAFLAQYDLEVVNLPSTLVSIGYGAFQDCFGINEVTIPDSVESIHGCAFKNCTFLEIVNMGKGVETIDSEAFRNCSMLIDLECFDGLESIGADAFDNCWRMLSVSLPSSVTNVAAGAFAGCSHISGVCVPVDVKPLAEMFPAAKDTIVDVWLEAGETNLCVNAFRNLSSMAEMYLPAGVTEIPDGAFYGCAKMTNVTWQTAPQRIGANAFSGCISLPSVAELPDSCRVGVGAFQGCSRFTSFRLPSVMDEVPDNAFNGCSGLRAVTFGGTIGRIGNYAFYNCTAFTSFPIPNSVTNIGNDAFCNCSGLTSVTIPDSATIIGSSAFEECRGLKSVTIGNGVTSIGSSAFYNCSELKSVTIPNSVTSIGERAFYYCRGLKSVTIGNGVKAIPQDMFYDCHNLADVMIGNGVTNIGSCAFQYCSRLTSITMPASVTRMGGSVFSGCYDLRKVYYLGDAPIANGDLYYTDWYYYNGSYCYYLNLTNYVLKSTRGWDGIENSRALPEKWPAGDYGCPITYWEANTFDLVFDGNGGTPATNVIAQTTDATYVLPATDPEREGWAFDGWWTERSAGARVTPSVPVKAAEAHTLYAHWTLLGIPAKVRFFTDGVESEQEFTVGISYGSLPAPTKNGYLFRGWKTADGEEVTAASVVRLAGAQLYAQWQAGAYSVRFMPNGGMGTMENQAFIYNMPQALASNAFTRTDYAFAGWATNATAEASFADGALVTNLTEEVGGTVALSATWVRDMCTLTFNANGGALDGASSRKVKVGVAVGELPVATREDYALEGWRLPDGTMATAETVFQDNATLTAVWVRDMCTLTFNANGGILSDESSRKVKMGVAVGTLPAATRAGYSLAGWKMADGTLATAETVFSDNATLTAVWEPLNAQTDTPTISPGDGTQFTTSSQTVTITCPVSGAVIYYTKNGTTPRTTSAYRYTGPFTVSDTATIVAVATAEGMERSAYARATLTKVDAAGAALAGALGVAGVEVTTGGKAWTAAGDGTVRSGAVGANGTSWMKVTVSGAGTLTFRWRVSCEEDDGGTCSWDRLVFQTNGVEVARIDGDSGWITNSVTFSDGGDHVVRWAYVKDGYDVAGETGEDCGWVGGVTWTPQVTSPITYVGLAGALHMNPATYVEGTAFVFAAPSARIGYAFAGWTPSGIGSDTKGPVTATATWTELSSPGISPATGKYTVTFYGGGKTLGTATVETGKNTNQAAASVHKPTRAGYVLTGWYDKDGKILFDAQGRAANGVYWNGSYVKGSSSATWKYAGNVTAYAYWAPNKCTVTFYGGGKTLGTATVETGKNTNQAAASVHKPTRAGYVLTGWYDKDGKILFDSQGFAADGTYWNGSYVKGVSSATWKYAGNVTAYAYWAKASVKYTVTFYGGGKTLGTATMETGKNTNQAAASVHKPTRAGYVLTGWYDKDGKILFDSQGFAADGTYWNGSYVKGTSSATWKYAGNVTAYAHWAQNSNANAAARKTPNVVGPKGVDELFAAGELAGMFADGKGSFALTLDEGLETAYLVTWTADGGVTCECEATVADDTLVLTTEAGEVYCLTWDGGSLVAMRVTE